jgi:hypothetical protein
VQNIRVLRKILGYREEEEVQGNCKQRSFLICDPNKQYVIKSRRIRRADGMYGDAKTDLVGQLEGKRPLGRPRNR